MNNTLRILHLEDDADFSLLVRSLLEAEQIPAEVISGLTLAALAIPEVMGYTKISGTPVITGLYTLLIPTALFACFGSSRHLVVGADSATAAILAAGLAGLAATGSDAYVALAVSQYPLLLLDERADMADSVMLSAELTKGHRGVLLTAFLLPFAIALTAYGVFRFAGIQSPGDAPLVIAAVVPVATVLYAFWACLNAALFLELLADHDRRLVEEAAPDDGAAGTA